MKGQVVSGDLGKVVIRQKSSEDIALGELLVTEDNILLQVTDLVYGSQISQQNLELISGMRLEDNSDLTFYDEALRNYTLAIAKPILSLKNTANCKSLPKFFGMVRSIAKQDINFLTKPENSLYLGKLRSGRSILDVDIYLPGKDVLSHHVLLPATTGKGKSNLTKVMLWDCIGKSYCGILVLDPHDEYYGRTGLGLKDHPSRQISYYTTNPPPGAGTLKINISDVRPSHFEGAVSWSDAQRQALYAAYKKYNRDWINGIFSEEPLEGFMEGTLSVVKRKIKSVLEKNIFDVNAGQTTITDICNDLEAAKAVIIDTSSFSGSTEILIGSIIITELLKKYKHYKMTGELESKPVISIVIEEAPRVIGNEVLQQGSNIFETIAREGRKFRIGLVAITQIPSAIPRNILANMNTKIILGLEMKPERDAIIDSASQDLSMDSRNIASLDKGEALITSSFTKFAIPVKIPLFEDVAKKYKVINEYSGIRFT